MKLNNGLLSLEEDYVFSEVSRRVRRFASQNPDARLISLGIGDVRGPICPAVTRAMRQAVADQARQKTFHGYGPEQGYQFLRQAIAAALTQRGAPVPPRDIFISDGAKTDLGGIFDLFAPGGAVLLCDPTYPAVRDDCRMRGLRPVSLPGTEANGFLPLPPAGDGEVDAVYLCSRANPTGAVYDREQLAAWVEYARSHEALLIFDSAYESFITDPKLPRSIYEIPGAKGCAVEIGSFSKVAGFTGTRCGYTVFPTELQVRGVSLQALWRRRLASKSNGVAYVVQRGAAAVYSLSGRQQTARALGVYRQNSSRLAAALTAAGLPHWGGLHSPYLWLKCPRGLSSWGFFDFLLQYGNLVGTPGIGFGPMGEGYFRLSAFGDPASVEQACDRLSRALEFLR